MRYLALACDYDGTLALHGAVDAATTAALERWRASGRKLLMVTGRRLEELVTVFSRLDLFEWIVAENGALLFHPATRHEQPLAERPGETFMAALKDRGVAPFDVGHIIVATWEPHETVVLETIRDLGLELQVIFNKGAVMILPPGINKATGLAAALGELGISPHNVVAIGDAENDHALLDAAEVGVAVANAVPMLKERADLVTMRDHGAGVAELIDQLIADDLRTLTPQLSRHHLALGSHLTGGQEFLLPPQGVNMLITGSAGSGKTQIAGAWLEQLNAAAYQYCAIDPEGDLDSLPGAIVVGGSEQVLDPDEVLKLLVAPQQNVVVCLRGLQPQERTAWYQALVGQLDEMRAHTGRPHWLVLYQAPQIVPASTANDDRTWSSWADGLLLLAEDPRLVAPATLREIDVVLAVGDRPDRLLKATAGAMGAPLRDVNPARLASDEAWVWDRRSGPAAAIIRVARAKVERTREHRIAVDGELAPGASFYFRGPDQKLNLRAQNLVTFLQLAAGVDDDTWHYHLRQGDYSSWLRHAVGDETLGDEVAKIEGQQELLPGESLQAVRSLIETRYGLASTAS